MMMMLFAGRGCEDLHKRNGSKLSSGASCRPGPQKLCPRTGDDDDYDFYDNLYDGFEENMSMTITIKLTEMIGTDCGFGNPSAGPSPILRGLHYFHFYPISHGIWNYFNYCHNSVKFSYLFLNSRFSECHICSSYFTYFFMVHYHPWSFYSILNLRFFP